MSKRFLTLGILLIVLAGIFTPFSFVKAETYNENCIRIYGLPLTPYCQRVAADPARGNNPMPGSLTPEQLAAQAAEEKKSAENANNMSLGGAIYEMVAKGVGELLTKLSALVLSMVGVLFDAVMKYTVVQMADNLGSSGIGAGITSAWTTLRDVANMFFIFVLLFVAFKAMFELNFGSLGTAIRNIILVALLINFSLFFSKVVIDASNIAAVGFYKSIVTANTTARPGTTGTTPAPATSEKTISTGYMYLLGLQSWNSPNFFKHPTLTDPTKILIIGIMSSVFLLVTAVILLITTVMFLARFIILIFLMILSPLALIAIIIPGQMDNFNKWKNALLDQSFFAPIFFAMTWVVFKLANGMTASFKTSPTGADLSFIDTMGSNPTDSVGIILNFVLIIGFAIAALVVSKAIATRGATATAFKAISGGIGTAAIGGAAFAGRRVIGGTSKMIAESSGLRNAASSGKWYSGAARASLWTANKGAKSSFDVRASDTLGKVPGLGKEMDILGKAGGKGGFTKAVEEKAKAKATYAKEVYGQTDAEKDEIKEKETKYDKVKKDEEPRIREARKKSVETAKETARRNDGDRQEYLDNKLKPQKDAAEAAEQEKKRKEEEHAKIKNTGTPTQIFNSEQELAAAQKKAGEEKKKFEALKKNVEETDETYKELKEIADGSNEELRMATEKLSKKIDESDYSNETQDLGKDLEKIKSAAVNRQEAYAKRLDEGIVGKVAAAIGAGSLGGGVGAVAGGIVGGPIGAGIGAAIGAGVGVKTSRQEGKAAARAVRKQMKGKTTDEEAAELLRKMDKERKEKEGKAKSEDENKPKEKTESNEGEQEKT